MTTSERVAIPARKGTACFVAKGQQFKVVNTHGQQVVDTWAFNRDDVAEFMSLEHCRTAIDGILPRAGDIMVTNKRRPILHFVEDTSGGLHDTLMSACDRYRYELLGCEGYHDNCTDNLRAELTELGLTPPDIPSPWNLFMNIPVQPNGNLTFEPPVCQPGNYVLLRAEMDCVMAFSACPQDVVPVNGVDRQPTEAHYQLL